MSDFKGTPGPWEVRQALDGVAGAAFAMIRIANDKVGSIALTHVQDGRRHVNKMAECEANARLIAAAPELLRVVDEFRRLLDMPIMKEFCPVWGGYSELVDEVMAKALGDE